MSENKFTLDYINVLHEAIKSTVHYKGSVGVADDLNYIEGDVFIDTSTQTNYIYTNDRWSPLSKGDTIHYDTERGEDDMPNEIRKIRSVCSHCGGVLVPNLSSEATICTYCGCANSTFVYESDPEFARLP